MTKRHSPKLWTASLFLGTIFVLLGTKALAQGDDLNFRVESLEIFINSLWLVVAGALVFFMNAGFAMLEAGSCRRKSLINILAKNVVVFCVTTIAFWLLGFSLMFGDGQNALDNKSYECPTESSQTIYSYIGKFQLPFQLSFPHLSANEKGQVDKSINPLGYPSEGFTCLKEIWPNRSFASIFFFQLVFAGTAATIVSGAVAERVKFWAFFGFAFILTLIIYPLVGHWVWGTFGWLDQYNFRDFAGSTVVHSVGGSAALVGAWLLGPRWTKFGYEPQDELRQYEPSNNREIKYGVPEDLKQDPFTPHNLAFLTLGGLILWLGWIGFNGGSTTDLSLVPHIVVTTLVSAAVSGVTAIVAVTTISTIPEIFNLGRVEEEKPSLGMFLNGILGGLVAITASSAYVGMWWAAAIGLISGIWVVVFDLIIMQRWWKIDDPVGAVAVHLGCGGWGTLAVGLAATTSSPAYNIQLAQSGLLGNVVLIITQLLGWLLIVGFAIVASFLAWGIIGLFLFSIELSKTKKINPNKPSFINNLFLAMRYGIRASVRDEYVGSYDFFSDPKRNQRTRQLEAKKKIITSQLPGRNQV